MSEDSPHDIAAGNPLLCPGDPAPVKVTNPGGRSPFLLLGDHAGRAIPKSLGLLGLPPQALDLHIAWDIGVAGMGNELARLLDARFKQQTYSRLVIDCNRRPDAADSIPPESDQIHVPGNTGLKRAQAADRCAAIYQPYHDAIAAELDRRAHEGFPTMLVSLHSFTPVMQGRQRPWKFGVLHQHDSVLSDRVLHLLTARFGAEVGDNQPYSLDAEDNTIPLHAIARGLEYLELEVRQDLIVDSRGQSAVAEIVADVLRDAAHRAAY